MDEEKFIEFFKLVEKLKTVTRHSWTSDRSRKESVAEHSWMVSLMALISLQGLKNKKLDHTKILKLAIIHDFVESLAGDIPTHEQNGSGRKQETERVAKERIVSCLPSEVSEEIGDLWDEYEAQETEEAKVIRALDKIEVGFQHNTADFSTWDDGDKSYPIDYAEEYAKMDPFLKELNRINMRWRKRKIASGK